MTSVIGWQRPKVLAMSLTRRAVRVQPGSILPTPLAPCTRQAAMQRSHPAGRPALESVLQKVQPSPMCPQLDLLRPLKPPVPRNEVPPPLSPPSRPVRAPPQLPAGQGAARGSPPHHVRRRCANRPSGEMTTAAYRPGSARPKPARQPPRVLPTRKRAHRPPARRKRLPPFQCPTPRRMPRRQARATN